MNYVDTHDALIDAARLWVRTTSFAEHIPQELRTPGRDGNWHYRTDSVDTKVADALLDLWAAAGRWTVTVGKKKLAALAGVSPNTALAAINRLSPWFVDATGIDEYGMTLIAGEILVSLKLTPTYQELQRGGQFQPNENQYTPRRAADPYQSGASRTVKQMARKAVKTLAQQANDQVARYLVLDAMTPATDGGFVLAAGLVDTAREDALLALAADAQPPTPRQWIDDNTLPGMGEPALRILDALTRCGELTVQDLADETGKTLGSIRRAAIRLERFGAVLTTRETPRSPKVYELATDVYQMIDARAHEFRTYQMADCREEQRLQEAMCWATRQHSRAADEDGRAAAWARLERLTTKRIDVLARLHPDWPVDLVKIVAADVPVKQWTQARGAVAANARIARERMAAYMATVDLANEWRNLGDEPDADKRRMMVLAGYDAADVYRAQRKACNYERRD